MFWAVTCAVVSIPTWPQTCRDVLHRFSSFSSFSSSNGAGIPSRNVKSVSTSTKIINGKKIVTKRFANFCFIWEIFSITFRFKVAVWFWNSTGFWVSSKNVITVHYSDEQLNHNVKILHSISFFVPSFQYVRRFWSDTHYACASSPSQLTPRIYSWTFFVPSFYTCSFSIMHAAKLLQSAKLMLSINILRVINIIFWSGLYKQNMSRPSCSCLI